MQYIRIKLCENRVYLFDIKNVCLVSRARNIYIVRKIIWYIPFCLEHFSQSCLDVNWICLLSGKIVKLDFIVNWKKNFGLPIMIKSKQFIRVLEYQICLCYHEPAINPKTLPLSVKINIVIPSKIGINLSIFLLSLNGLIKNWMVSTTNRDKNNFVFYSNLIIKKCWYSYKCR